MDILETLKQTFDEKKIEMSHVVYWVQVTANALRVFHYKKHDTGMFISTFSSVTVQTDTSLKNRKYIALPAVIYDLDDESAVNYITYNFETGCCCSGPSFAQTKFNRTTAQKAEALYYDDDSKPTPANPFFYRIGNRLYFLGLECVNVSDVEVALFTALDPSDFCDLDTEVPVPDDLLPHLKQEVLKMGGFVMMVPQERINDGANRQQNIPNIPEIAEDERT